MIAAGVLLGTVAVVLMLVARGQRGTSYFQDHPSALVTHVESPGDRKRREEAEQTATIASIEAMVRASEADAAAARERYREERSAALRAMTAAQRAQEIRDECRKATCDTQRLDDILAAAPSGESAPLKALRKQEEAAQEKRLKDELSASQKRYRETFAKEYEEALLGRHMNPDGVSAEGTQLTVRGWFC